MNIIVTSVFQNVMSSDRHCFECYGYVTINYLVACISTASFVVKHASDIKVANNWRSHVFLVLPNECMTFACDLYPLSMLNSHFCINSALLVVLHSYIV